jgi:hypothetical protein
MRWMRWRSCAPRTTGPRAWPGTRRSSPRAICTAVRAFVTGTSCWRRWRAFAGGWGGVGGGERAAWLRRGRCGGVAAGSGAEKLPTPLPAPCRYNVTCSAAGGGTGDSCGLPVEQAILGVAQAGPRRGCDLQAQLEALQAAHR